MNKVCSCFLPSRPPSRPRQSVSVLVYEVASVRRRFTAPSFLRTLYTTTPRQKLGSLSPLFPHANSRSSSSPCLSPSLLPTFPTPHGENAIMPVVLPPSLASSRSRNHFLPPPPPSLQFVGEHSRREVERKREKERNVIAEKKRFWRGPFIRTARRRGGSHFGIRRWLLRSKNRQTNVDGEGPGRKLFPNETAL